VQDPTDYQAWLSGGASESPAAQGEKLFQSLGCASCHKLDAQGRGPVLTGVFGKPQKLDNGQEVLADEAYIRESILDPQNKRVLGFGTVLMPSFRGQVTEEQILTLIAYIRALGAPPGAAATGGGTTNTAAPAPSSTTTSGIDPNSQRSNPLNATSPRTGANANTPGSRPPQE
jgi:cytochrome c oxidase subunit 2